MNNDIADGLGLPPIPVSPPPPPPTPTPEPTPPVISEIPSIPAGPTTSPVIPTEVEGSSSPTPPAEVPSPPSVIPTDLPAAAGVEGSSSPTPPAETTVPVPPVIPEIPSIPAGPTTPPVIPSPSGILGINSVERSSSPTPPPPPKKKVNKKLVFGGTLVLLLLGGALALAAQLGLFRGDLRQRASGGCPGTQVNYCETSSHPLGGGCRDFACSPYTRCECRSGSTPAAPAVTSAPAASQPEAPAATAAPSACELGGGGIQCGSITCPDGKTSFGSDDCYQGGSCADRERNACAGHQAGGAAPTTASGTGGGGGGGGGCDGSLSASVCKGKNPGPIDTNGDGTTDGICTVTTGNNCAFDWTTGTCANNGEAPSASKPCCSGAQSGGLCVAASRAGGSTPTAAPSTIASGGNTCTPGDCKLVSLPRGSEYQKCNASGTGYEGSYATSSCGGSAGGGGGSCTANGKTGVCTDQGSCDGDLYANDNQCGGVNDSGIDYGCCVSGGTGGAADSCGVGKTCVNTGGGPSGPCTNAGGINMNCTTSTGARGTCCKPSSAPYSCPNNSSCYGGQCPSNLVDQGVACGTSAGPGRCCASTNAGLCRTTSNCYGGTSCPAGFTKDSSPYDTCGTSAGSGVCCTPTYSSPTPTGTATCTCDYCQKIGSSGPATCTGGIKQASRSNCASSASLCAATPTPGGVAEGEVPPAPPAGGGEPAVGGGTQSPPPGADQPLAGTGVPPGGVAGACVATRLYINGGTSPATAAQIASLQIGNTIRLAVRGNQASFTKGRFVIKLNNSVLTTQETTTKQNLPGDPATFEFIYDYTITQGGNYSIEGSIWQ